MMLYSKSFKDHGSLGNQPRNVFVAQCIPELTAESLNSHFSGAEFILIAAREMMQVLLVVCESYFNSLYIDQIEILQ